jgi:hypothetical protein
MAVWVSLSQSVWGRCHAEVVVIEELIEENVKNIYCMEKYSEKKGGVLGTAI